MAKKTMNVERNIKTGKVITKRTAREKARAIAKDLAKEVLEPKGINVIIRVNKGSDRVKSTLVDNVYENIISKHYKIVNSKDDIKKVS